MLKICAGLQPGAADYEEAIEVIHTVIGDLDTALISVAVGSFERISTSKSTNGYQEELVQVSKQVAQIVSQIVNAVRMESPEAVGKACKVIIV